MLRSWGARVGSISGAAILADWSVLHIMYHMAPLGLNLSGGLGQLSEALGVLALAQRVRLAHPLCFGVSWIRTNAERINFAVRCSRADAVVSGILIVGSGY